MAMRSVTLEVPANHSLLRKTGRADVWLKPLIRDIEKKKMESHNCLTVMNDIVHSTLKGTIEELQESRNLLEQQNRGLTSELATAKVSSSQFKRDKELLECSLSEELSKASEEVRELKALLAKKEEYAGELVQSLTQAQVDLQTSSDEIRALKSSHASLEASLDSHLAEHQILKNDLAMWEREYGLLEENFNIEKSQQPIDTPSPALDAPGMEELLNEEVATAAIGVAIPAPEGETSMTQSMEAEAPVTLASLGDFNIPSPIQIAHITAPS
ncbi:uncharacterized protein [Nicotiana sylvestris]|uniref:uncharacterized protein n=1 Tax=Nicotiana sylvestris TaxID=4096 RepID=UPI00388C6851